MHADLDGFFRMKPMCSTKSKYKSTICQRQNQCSMQLHKTTPSLNMHEHMLTLSKRLESIYSRAGKQKNSCKNCKFLGKNCTDICHFFNTLFLKWDLCMINFAAHKRTVSLRQDILEEFVNLNAAINDGAR